MSYLFEPRFKTEKKIVRHSHSKLTGQTIASFPPKSESTGDGNESQFLSVQPDRSKEKYVYFVVTGLPRVSLASNDLEN